MTYNFENDNSHIRFYCKVHKKHIFFFTKDAALTGHYCWDCLKERNDATWKSKYIKEDDK